MFSHFLQNTTLGLDSLVAALFIARNQTRKNPTQLPLEAYQDLPSTVTYKNTQKKQQ